MLSVLAEAVGFEPTSDFTRYPISSRGRYDHFDTPPYRLAIIYNIYQKSKRSIKLADMIYNLFSYLYTFS